jgi:hypothetical protein
MIYRKRGSVVRWENGTLLRVSERGIAVEEGESFECRPEPGEALSPLDSTAVLDAVRAVQSATGGVEIERLIVSEGVAQHEYGERRWSEQTRRVHLSLIRARTRVLLDLGSFDIKDVARVADALQRVESRERDAPPRLRLAPNVTAALLPVLIGIAPPNVCLWQTAGGVDGCGNEIVEARDAWPNWYRPSYRVRPQRMPQRLRLECDVTAIDRDGPIAVAILAPPELIDGRLLLHVLIDDGPRVYPSTVRLTRIDAVSDERIWYPYGGGSFGAEMML